MNNVRFNEYYKAVVWLLDVTEAVPFYEEPEPIPRHLVREMWERGIPPHNAAYVIASRGM